MSRPRFHPAAPGYVGRRPDQEDHPQGLARAKELREAADVSGELTNIRKSKVLTSIVVSIVRACTRFAWPTLIAGLVLAVAGAVYTARHFVINTDINTLISENLDWRQRD